MKSCHIFPPLTFDTVSVSNIFSGNVVLLTFAAFRIIWSASSFLPMLSSHRGDSGMILKYAARYLYAATDIYERQIYVAFSLYSCK